MTILSEMSPAILGSWVQAAILVGTGLAVWLGIINRSSIQKREVSFGFEPAAKKILDDHIVWNAAEHDKIHSKIGGVDRGNANKISQEITAVHLRVNVLEKSVGGLETASELTNQQLARVEAKIDRLIERRT